jgi:lysyl-tRNA synthetase class 2
VKSTTINTLFQRASALRATREFFWGRGFREIDTPLSAAALIPESTIEVFTTEFHDHLDRPRSLFLIPSPEVHMKRLLAQGSGDIFQLTKCFRNREPPTGAHHPEFTMLEWYAVEKNYLDQMVLQEEYFDWIRRALGTGATVTVRNRKVNLVPPFARLSMREAFLEIGGLDLDRLSAMDSLEEGVANLGIDRTPSDTWESLFHKIFLEKIEPGLPTDRPLFLFDYPAALPTLARIAPGGRYAERWELYAGGLEIANCYTEERDRERIMAFFAHEAENKKMALVPHPADRELAELMAAGLPECSGNALGFDRLLMVLLEKSAIQEVIPFPWFQDE